MNKSTHFLVGAVLIAPLLMSGASPAAAANTSSITLNMDTRAPSVSSNVAVKATVISAKSGSVTYASSRQGQGAAASFPAYGSGRSAAIAITNTGSTDVLAPGSQAFSFGADFRPGNGKADGDNIMQRGLADDSGQYKLEVDSGFVSCNIKGQGGAVIVRTGPAVVSGVWYSARCSRNGTTITLKVERLDTGANWSSSRTAAVGVIATKKATTALTVGAKVTPALQIANWSPDQFNGLIDNVFLQIGN